MVQTILDTNNSSIVTLHDTRQYPSTTGSRDTRQYPSTTVSHDTNTSSRMSPDKSKTTGTMSHDTNSAINSVT